MKKNTYEMSAIFNTLPGEVVHIDSGATDYADQPYKIENGWKKVILPGDRPGFAANIRMLDGRLFDELEEDGEDLADATYEGTIVVFQRYTGGGLNSSLWIFQIGNFTRVVGEDISVETIQRLVEKGSCFVPGEVRGYDHTLNCWTKHYVNHVQVL